MRATPIQVKALIYRATVGNRYHWNDKFKTASQYLSYAAPNSYNSNYVYTQLQLQTINRVEALDGYNRQDPVIDTDPASPTFQQRIGGGEIMLNSPIWKPMHEILYPGATPLPNAENRLCRSVPYEKEEYLIKRSENCDLPTYDQYFIMLGRE